MLLLPMGTGPFAVPTFRALLESDHQVAALVTRPAHGRRPPPNPMRSEAEARGVAVLDPEDVNSEGSRAELAALRADLLVVCDYGQILKPATLAVARLGGINLHGSLLPRYRGAAPVQWAVYHGERETGNTVIHMTPGLDAGPALAQCRTPIDPAETAGELEARLAELGPDLVLQVIDQLAQGTAAPVEQEKSQATRAPRIKKSDGLLDWSRSAAELHDQVRAFQPWPQAFTHWPRGDQEPLRLIVRRVAPRLELPTAGAAPGALLDVAGRLCVATGAGALELVEVQPAGKRAMAAAEFLRGHPAEPGQRLT